MKCLMLTGWICLLSLALFAQSNSPSWSEVSNPANLSKRITAQEERIFQVNFNELRSFLAEAPSERQQNARNSAFILSLPQPNGSIANFKLVESPIMAPELQAEFPEIRTFVGVGQGEYSGASLRADFTLKGFHAQILIAGKTYYIDPYSDESLNHYLVYTRESFFTSNQKEFPSCETEASSVGSPVPNHTPAKKKKYRGDLNLQKLTNGSQLRTYRLALACTGEYATFHGGTTPDAMSAMVTTMNRVNGIYERDLAIRMVMVANNSNLIYLNGATDPYSNENGVAMLSENQTNCDAVIGSANYDVGHVFSTGGGGIATLKSPCNNSSKARGVTGLFSPVGDPFDVDYVAHEFGHQWGANHTQNNDCNRVPSAAYEPGSASTIMGYAGICAPNLQSNSDAHFHNHSITEMYNYAVTGFGNSCAATSTTGNTPPSVTMPSGGFYIPIETPFELTGSATDANGDDLTYCWEQYDLGPVTSFGDSDLSNPSGTAPIFRSFPPTDSPTRVFPRISDLINNTTVVGELLPTYTRALNFKLTVRDNNSGSGGVDDGLVNFTATATAGPFIVTAPNTSESWQGNSSETVTWNVANTNTGLVNSPNVDIFMSADGGLTYPFLLADDVPNDGSQDIVVPNVTTTDARIKVKGANNIFFDISNTNFSVNQNFEFSLDAQLVDIIEPVGSVCGSSFTPVINVANQGSTQINSLMIQYSFGGSSYLYFNFIGDIDSGENTNIELPSLSILDPGTANFLATITSVNGSEDENIGNNTASEFFILTDPQTGLNLPVLNDFEGDFPGTGWTVNNPDELTTWAQSTVSANCVGSNSAFMNNYIYNEPGEFDDLISPRIDLAGTFIPTISFDVAYASYNTSLFDGLQVDVRNVCDTEWTNVYFKEGDDLETAPPTNSLFSPGCDEWRNDMVNLSEFSNQVIEIRFRTINGFGNRLYLDNIQVSEEVEPCNNSVLYPNDIIPIDPNGAVTTIDDFSWSGDYTQVSGIESGNTYEFNMEGGGFITIRDAAPLSGEVLAFGNAPLQYTAGSNDNLFIHWSGDPQCPVNAIDITTTGQCLSCAPCNNISIFTQYPSTTISVDPAGAVTTIAPDQFAGGEYSQINGIQSGNNYEFNIASGGYATVREGVPDGPVLGYGPVPLEVTATSNQNLFVHWNTDDLCGTSDNEFVLSTVQCTSCSSSSTLNGRIIFVPNPACSPIDGVVKVYQAGTANLLEQINISVEIDPETGFGIGTFEIGMYPNGLYDVFLKLDRYLRISSENVNVGNQQDIIINFNGFVLGDIDETADELIDIVDLQLILDVVGQPDLYITNRDLNCDGVIDIVDLQIILDNIGLSQGAQLPD